MYDELLEAVNYAGVIAGLSALAGLLAGLLIARRGYKWLLALLGYKDSGEGYSTKSAVSVDASGMKTVRLNHKRH